MEVELFKRVGPNGVLLWTQANAIPTECLNNADQDFQVGKVSVSAVSGVAGCAIQAVAAVTVVFRPLPLFRSLPLFGCCRYCTVFRRLPLFRPLPRNSRSTHCLLGLVLATALWCIPLDVLASHQRVLLWRMFENFRSSRTILLQWKNVSTSAALYDLVFTFDIT